MATFTIVNEWYEVVIFTSFESLLQYLKNEGYRLKDFKSVNRVSLMLALDSGVTWVYGNYEKGTDDWIWKIQRH
jgi:hypothetical protein